MGLLCAAGLLGVLNAVASPAHAAPTDPQQQSSVGLEGVIPTNPPTVGATITFPTNGQTFTTLPINVTGICPDGLLIKLFKNEVFAGSAQCNNGSYSITIDLFNGVNELVARVYDALDQAGPDSNKVSVNFSDPNFGLIGTRISITSNFAKRGANPGETLTWPLILSGGTPPYAISVDWGDGKTDLLSRAFGGSFDISHIYDSPGVYNILVKVSDSTGASAFLQVVGVANGSLGQDNSGSKDGTVIRTVIIWWPMIIAAFLIIISFWLGRKDQLRSLRKEAERRTQY